MEIEEELREPLVGVHHYFAEDLVFEGVDKMTDEKLKDNLVINRTNFNE